MRLFRLAALAAALALPLLGLAAPAASALPQPNAPTLACEVTFPTCEEPVAAISFGPNNYIQAFDFAMTTHGVQTWLDPDNTEGDGTQDFAFAQIATVPPPGGGPGAFGFTGFDRHNYGLSGVFEVEWTPFGQDSGKCLQALNAANHFHASLRWCDGGADQAWIVVTHSLPLVQGPGHPLYVYALSVVQSPTAQHHLCLTGGVINNTVSRCINKDISASDTQRWSGLH
jgi:hypothetical protein